MWPVPASGTSSVASINFNTVAPNSFSEELEEEVDQQLGKRQVQMYGAVQSGGRSPKPVNGPAGASQLKPGSDSAQNSSSSFPSQGKGKKRERTVRADDADSGQIRPEQMLKSEIAKITDRGGLVDFEGVDKLVQLMQPDNVEKKLDLACRIMLANVIAVTDRFDCLTRFVQLRGLPVLDDWLQEVHKGKIGDSSSPKESDKSVEEFLLSLLRALDKLPVNLHALQTSNVGKSVNHLRTHKNSEIQKKARSLVDTWKKRVEAEMNMIDAKSGSSRGGSWPTKSVISEVSNVSGRRTGGPSDPGAKSSNIQSCASKTTLGKIGSGDKLSPASPGSSKLSTSITATSVVASTKDPNSAALVGAGSSDMPLTITKEEKSSSSSQSQNNSQSCSSEYGKTVSCREDARSSTAGSMTVNKISSGVSRNRKSNNGIHGTAAVGVQKESKFGKYSSINRSLASEKVSPVRVTSERIPDVPLVDNGNSQRLIVRLPNAARSPARSASGGGSPEETSATFCKGNPQVQCDKSEHQDRKVKERSETLWNNSALKANMDLCHGKDELAGSDVVHMTSVIGLCDNQNRAGEGSDKMSEASKPTGSPSGITAEPGKSYEASFSSINALIDSCAKFSEANATASVGDDIGMNLLASVAAGEISTSDVSPLGSPRKKSTLPEDLCSGNDAKLRKTDEGRARSEDHCNDGSNGGAMTDHISSINSFGVKTGVQHDNLHIATNLSSDSKVTSFGCEEKTQEGGAQLESSYMDLPHHGNGPVPTSDVKLPESIEEDSTAMSTADAKKEVNAVGKAAEQFQELRKMGHTRGRDGDAPNSKLKASSPLSDEVKNIDCANEKSAENSVAVLPKAAATCTKVEAQANEESTSCSSSDSRDDKTTMNKLSGFESKVAKIDEMKAVSHTEQSEDKKSCLGPSTSDHKIEVAHGNSEKKEVTCFLPSGSAPIESLTLPVQESEQPMKSTRCNSNGAEEYASRPNLDFDLNEGLPVDDGSSGELVKLPVCGNSSSIHMPCPLPISISSMPGSLPSSVTVAAAAKGPFVPPESPLRIKGELGWKGSAATSAFRPAEPRKILDMPLSATDVPLVDNSSSRHGRPLLDFDLNVPDQRALEDLTPQNSVPVTCSESGPGVRSSGGGLNLDLNRCDEISEIGQFSVSNSSRLEISELPGRSFLSGGLPIAESNALRGFDLNNGPGPDEVGNETAVHTKNGMPFLSSVPTVRMNNMELGNFPSWFPPGTSYSAIAMPPILPGRGDQNYPILPATSTQRMLGPPSGNTSFGPEIYRSPVLSSSPAVGFPPTTFQYPGFPFDTNFPLSSNSYSGVSTPYVDSSSAGPLCIPALTSQLMGPTGMVSTHYPRPYVMSLPSGTSNNVPESRKWGSQGLDLNAGPGIADLDRRDERLPSTLRQLPLTGSQALADEQLKMYQMTGGKLKRKEPEGGWDGDRISYKHPSWQ